MSERKIGLVTGIANKMSIAYGIAKKLKEEGYDVILTYQGGALEKRIKPIAEELDVKACYVLDVTDQNSVKQVFDNIKRDFGKLDFILHSIAFSDRKELEGKFIDTSLDNFTNTMNISCYSLISLCKHAEEILSDDASILALTYYGSQKVIPNYNVMGVAKAALETSVKYLANDLGPRGIRVNALSAGPIKTLASSGIGDFRTMLDIHKSTSPLRRNVDLNDVAGSGFYLISNLSRAVTGETHYVDSGYNIMGMSKN